jgi:integrase
LITVSTKCTDETAARQVLADLVRRVEHVRAGVLSPQQDCQARHAGDDLAAHIEVYLEHLRAKTVRGKRVSVAHRGNVEHQIRKVVADCHCARLADLRRETLERWMNRAEQDGMGARTRNTYRAAIVAFCNWAVETDRLVANPLARLCLADERADRRRQRRALTEDEIRRLLTATRLRPLAEFGRGIFQKPEGERRGRCTWTRAALDFNDLEAAARRGREALKKSPEVANRLERLGRHRSLIYKAMLLTGLRKAELASITVGQLSLDAPQPYAELLAKDEKAGRGATIPLRADLVADLREQVAEDLLFLQEAALRDQQPVPARLPADMAIFDVPANFIKIFDRDLVAAGIPKRDERGRTVDVHALRHTFGTHLSKAGVPPRIAQAAMRHSSIHLTMNVYTDPALLDVAGAINALPDLSRDAQPKAAASSTTSA